MKTYRGRVCRINSFRKDEGAEVRLVQGNKVSIVRIEVPRLLAAKVAYSGASLLICVSDRGATRTITIKPNKLANKKAAELVRKLLAQDARETAAMSKNA